MGLSLIQTKRFTTKHPAELSISVIPAWSAGIQRDRDVSGCILANLDAGHPCRHDEDLYFHVLWAIVSL
jgi:hypothetical protein